MAMKMHFSQPRINRGLSIVELMVAVTIGLLLMGGAISIFVSNKNTYEITDDLSRLQENARYAIATMARDIRMVASSAARTTPLPSRTSSPSPPPATSTTSTIR